MNNLYVKMRYQDIYKDINLGIYTSDDIHLPLQQLLEHANLFILKNKIKCGTFLQLLVRTERGLQSIFTLNNNHITPIAIHQCEQKSYIEVHLEQESFFRANFALKVQTHQHNYESILEKLKNLSQIVRKQQEVLNDHQKRALDVAYFFAEPLVSIQGTDMYAVKQVSYQKEYNKFVQVLKNVDRNANVKMMVATEPNIKKALIQKVNILHFSCHGTRENKLKIETDIGTQFDMSADRLIELLRNKVLPKLVVLNVCHSDAIACQIFNALGVAAIGYNGTGLDNFCQLFTESFYQGVFKQESSIQNLFEHIKGQIREQDQTEANKLTLYCNEAIQRPISRSTVPSNTDWKQSWNELLNMGKEEPISIKKQLYLFIKNLFITPQKSLIFFTGEVLNGKTTFIKKAIHYTLNRKIFSSEISCDCRNTNSVLQLQLQQHYRLQAEIDNHRHQNVVVVIDHCQKLFQSERDHFMDYLQQQIFKKIKFGKIVVTCSDLIEVPKLSRIDKTHVYTKQKLNFSQKDLQQLITRWYPSSCSEVAQKLLQNKVPPYIIIDSLKNSNDVNSFSSNVINKQQNRKPLRQDCGEFDFFKEVSQIETYLQMIKKKIESLLLTGQYFRKEYLFPIVNFVPYIAKQKQKFQNGQKDQLPKQLDSLFDRTTCCFKLLNTFNISNDQISNSLRRLIPTLMYIPAIYYIQRHKQIQQLLKYNLVIIQVRQNYPQLINNDETLKIMMKNTGIRIKLALYCHYIYLSKKSQGEREVFTSEHKEVQIMESELMRGIKTDSELNKNIDLIKQVNQIVQKITNSQKYSFSHSKQSNQHLNQSQFLELTNDIQSLYEGHQKLKKFLKEQKYPFYGQEQLRIIQLCGLKLIGAFIQDVQNASSLQLSTKLRDKISKYRELTSRVQKILKQIKDYMKETADISFDPMYQEYVRGEVQIRFSLEQIYQKLGIQDNSLQVYHALVTRCIENKLIPKKKQIQNYILQSYSNNCIVLISSPLGIKDQNCDFVYVKRSQRRFERKIYQIYNQIAKEIYLKIDILSQKKLKQYQNRPVFMYLLICNCFSSVKKQIDSKVFLEGTEGLVERCKIESLYSHQSSQTQLKYLLPEAPIVIIYGNNANLFIKHYQSAYKMGSIRRKYIFLIVFQTVLENNHFQGLDTLKKQDLLNITNYVLQMQICNEFFQQFYGIFCRYLFEKQCFEFGDHIRNCFYHAKIEAKIRTKLQFGGGNNSKALKIIDSLYDEGLKINILSKDKEYHSELKQIKNQIKQTQLSKQYKEHHTDSILHRFKNNWEEQSENGYNFEILIILHELNQLSSCSENNKKKSMKYLLVRNTSEHQTYCVLPTLISKLSKTGLYPGGIICNDSLGEICDYIDYSHSSGHPRKLIIFLMQDPKASQNQLHQKLNKDKLYDSYLIFVTLDIKLTDDQKSSFINFSGLNKVEGAVEFAELMIKRTRKMHNFDYQYKPILDNIVVSKTDCFFDFLISYEEIEKKINNYFEKKNKKKQK